MGITIFKFLPLNGVGHGRVTSSLCASGLPKAAVISHLQSLKGAAGLWAYGGSSEDVVYIPLPLYHSAASLIGIGGTIELGNVVLSGFWS